MKKKLSVVMLSFACMVSVLCSGIAAQARVIHETDLEDYIMEEMSAANILGMGISIVSADKELYCAAYGAAQQTDADYVLGGLSQSFTAAGIMRMSEDGDLSLEDKVSDYLPEYSSVSDVTIQELLYQTSGLTAEQRMSDLKVTDKKGSFQYANANYNLLGEIIEEVSGMTYEEYISDNILDSLDMTSTYSLRTGSDMSEELLTGYQYYFGFPSASRYQYDKEDDWMDVPSGYLISDIKDMGKYLQMYLKEGGDVLSKASINAMLYDGVDVPADSSMSEDLFDGNAKYAMGWMEKEIDGKTILYHTGRVENFTSMMVLLPEEDLGITMLFNSMDYLVGQKLIQTLEEGIISIELGKTPEKADSNSSLIGHGIIDVIMLIVFIAAWMPVFLMGGWVRRRKSRLISMPGILVDALIHLVLPTVCLLLLPNIVPGFLAKRFIPDVYYVVIGVIASLYLGGVIKIITGIILKATGAEKEEEKKPELDAEKLNSEPDAESEEEAKEDEKEPESGKKEEAKEDEKTPEEKEPESEKKEEAKEDEKEPEEKESESGKKEEAKEDEKAPEEKEPEPGKKEEVKEAGKEPEDKTAESGEKKKKAGKYGKRNRKK